MFNFLAVVTCFMLMNLLTDSAGGKERLPERNILKDMEQINNEITECSDDLKRIREKLFNANKKSELTQVHICFNLNNKKDEMSKLIDELDKVNLRTSPCVSMNNEKTANKKCKMFYRKDFEKALNVIDLVIEKPIQPMRPLKKSSPSSNS